MPKTQGELPPKREAEAAILVPLKDHALFLDGTDGELDDRLVRRIEIAVSFLVLFGRLRADLIGLFP